jgi:hypothetical protein
MEGGASMSEQLTFDSLKEERAKERGRSVAAAKNQEILDVCRGIVRDLLDSGSETVDVEQVRTELTIRGIPFTPGNWMGSIFVGLGLRIVGYRKCSHQRGHARKVSVWAR